MIVILVRHAERLQSGNDPGLSAAGKRRASLLASMFADANVSTIFTSTARRTKDTAAPLAQRTGLTPRTIDDDANKAVAQILAGGACIVIVGHSDTVPMFIQGLGGPSGLTIDDDEFDRMFVLFAPTPGTASLLQMRYITT